MQKSKPSLTSNAPNGSRDIPFQSQEFGQDRHLHFVGFQPHFHQHMTHVSQVHVPNFGGLSGSEDRGGGDNSIQFTNFGRVGDKNF